MPWRGPGGLADRTQRAAARTFYDDLVYHVPLGGGPIQDLPIKGRYSSATERLQTAGGLEVLTLQPAVIVATADVPEIAVDLLIDIVTDGITYAIESWEIDEAGVSYTVFLIDPES